MNDLRVIKTEEQHLAYLQRVEQIILAGDDISPSEASELELLTVIIEAYEASRYPIDPVDPIEAIKFRMHEKGMKQSDLIPFIGPSGRVSEVLSRKRPLTVSMIRAISHGLGISADVLVGGGEETDPNQSAVDWTKFPVREILSRGWISDVSDTSRQAVAKSIEDFVAAAGLNIQAALFRRTLSGNADSPTSTYAIYAWLARVIQRARSQKTALGNFDRERLSAEFLNEVARLSWFQTGPVLALEFLRRNGIAVVIEPHLKGTHLDGVALVDTDGTPIVGMTLRYDRVDYFWFTLLHEVAHIWKHPFGESIAYVDDISRQDDDQREAEANKIAAEACIPRLVWRRSDAYLNPSRDSIEALAARLRIHPAIIVGRLQRERGDFTIFRELLGQGQVREMLSE